VADIVTGSPHHAGSRSLEYSPCRYYEAAFAANGKPPVYCHGHCGVHHRHCIVQFWLLCLLLFCQLAKVGRGKRAAQDTSCRPGARKIQSAVPTVKKPGKSALSV